MRGRTIGLITILAIGLFSGLLTANAQQPAKVYRIGWLDLAYESFSRAFLEQFRTLGWIEGQNFVMEYQTAPSKQFRGRAPDMAVELVRRNVDIIVAGGTAAALAAKAATATIPIVMAGSMRPVEQGLIESLARPGGNITGLTNSPGREFLGRISSCFRKLCREFPAWVCL